MTMLESIVCVVILTLLLILFLIFLVCKPWRFFFSSSSRSRTIKVFLSLLFLFNPFFLTFLEARGFNRPSPYLLDAMPGLVAGKWSEKLENILEFSLMFVSVWSTSIRGFTLCYSFLDYGIVRNKQIPVGFSCVPLFSLFRYE